MLAFVLYKTDKYRKENQKQQYFVFEKQTFLEHFDESESHDIISNCLITNYSKPETYNKQILDLYKEKGTELFTKLKGEFSFGIWDKQKQTFFGGRDRVGVKPFYYYNDDDIFIYSSALKFIKDFFGFTELNEYWIADALSGIVYDKTSTQFEKIFRMPPAHYMLVNKDKFEIKRYWELKVNKIENISEEDAIKMFKEKLFHAVNSRFFPDITGTELSGGLDSSGVTSIAAIRAKEIGSKLYSYSQRLADKYLGKIPPYKDEREYSDLVAEMYPNIILRPITAENRGIIEPMKKVIEIIGVPVSSPLTYHFDDMFETANKDEINIILSGFGGDQITSNYGTYFPIELAKNKKWKELKKYLNTSYFSKNFLSYYIIRNNSVYKKLYYKFKRIKLWQEEVYDSNILTEKFKEKVNLKERFKVLLNYNNYSNKNISTYDNYLINEFHNPFITKRLEDLGNVSRNYKIEQSHPLLDIDLIEFFINIPNNIKCKNGIKRYLYKKSFSNILHKNIVNRDDKISATVPNIWHRVKKDLKNITISLEYIDRNKFSENKEDIIKKVNNQNPKKRLNQNIFQTLLLINFFISRKY